MRNSNNLLLCLSIAIVLNCGKIVAQINSTFSLQQNDVVIEKNGSFDEIHIENCSFTDDIGKPQLPAFTETFVLPYNAIVSDIQVTTDQQQIQGNFHIIPAQHPIKLDGSDPLPFVEPDLSIYGSNTPYPNKTVEIVDDGYLYGYHIVTVKIYPIAYIPASGEIYLQNYNFTINYSISSRSSSGEQAQQSFKRAELTKQFVQSMVKNATDVESCRNNNIQIVFNNGMQLNLDTTNSKGGSTSAINTLVPDYIIITNNELKSTFQQLADWKTKIITCHTQYIFS